MASKYWIKLYHEILHDPKMGRLPDRLWRRAIELFLIAGESGDDGRLPDPEDMAWTLRCDAVELLEEMRALADEGVRILSETEDGRWVVTAFSDRQSASPVNKRVQRYRDSQRRAQYHGVDSETSADKECNAPVTNRYTEPDTEAEADSEEKQMQMQSDGSSSSEPRAVLFGLIQDAGILIQSSMHADQWADLLEITDDLELIREAFTEAAKTNVRASPKWMQTVLERCLKDGVHPGEWKDGKKSSRASPVDALAQADAEILAYARGGT